MRDSDKGHVPDWPKREVPRSQFENAMRRERRSEKTFVWLAKGLEHAATVGYDCNGMAIGVEHNGTTYLYD